MLGCEGTPDDGACLLIAAGQLRAFKRNQDENEEEYSKEKRPQQTSGLAQKRSVRRGNHGDISGPVNRCDRSRHDRRLQRHAEVERRQ